MEINLRLHLKKLNFLMNSCTHAEGASQGIPQLKKKK